MIYNRAYFVRKNAKEQMLKDMDNKKRKFNKSFKALGIIAAVILAMLSVLLLMSIYWMFKTWNSLTMDELLFHLTAPLEGTNEGMIREYIFTCAVPAVIIGILSITILLHLKNHKLFFLLPTLMISCSLAISILTTGYAWNKLDVGTYIDGQSTESTFIEDNYVSPTDVGLVFPEKKRNLIYIYLESMENTYADKKNGGAFEENIIPELVQLAEENEDFSGNKKILNGGIPMNGTSWTMGAMFAHTSGLPLSISIDGNDMDTQDSFFSGAVTLGDILDEAGYSQTLLIGSDAVFGGRELYFTEHGNYDIMDYNYALENGLIPKDYKVWWGYEDQKLFHIAKEKLSELALQDKPFNLTMLTVDTHFEDGYVCEQCKDTYGDNQYANVMSCSSRQLKEFIEWIQKQDFYENTSIVLAGDHLTMDKDFCPDINGEYVRKVYVNYINPGCDLQVNEYREYSTFDLFPTTVASLGVQIKGNRLGLGTNLFSSTQTLSERFGIQKQQEELYKKSVFLENLASIDNTKEELLQREEDRKPRATIKVSRDETAEGEISVTVKKIKNISETIGQIKLAVWTDENSSDKRYIDMQEKKEGVYNIIINEKDMLSEKKEYKISPCAMGESGKEYDLGEEVILLEEK